MSEKVKTCRVCQQGLELTYKRPEILRQFMNRRGKILSRRITKLCAKHQRILATEIDRARKLALLPYEELP
ncbi:MAG: 30S ribosomal protein S18 [Candidatus Bipolaricaulaceae bacterium]|nr:30S ribosomal protein S18 [Candidatus Bipolaricaulota bacterium]MCX7844604.1 30S ribosomal protein S18 [Candidatus Bipolaricaulota bacterium]MDW8152129.1 30S ribosomal protein S18 [Candidatus Bipolaricaulota bacterium]